MPTQWNSAAAAITTSASRSVIRWSETIAGTIPRRNSRRPRRSAMFVTIWTWTHEWSVSSSRAALTPAMCHHALTCGSALTASKSWSSLRLPRVGARIRIAAIASDGGGGTGGSGGAAGCGSGASASSIEARVLAACPGLADPLLQREAAAVVLDRDRARIAAGGERGGHRRGRPGAQHDHAADLRGAAAVHVVREAVEHHVRDEAVREGGAGRQAVTVLVEHVDVGRLEADRVIGVVDHPAEQQVVV